MYRDYYKTYILGMFMGHNCDVSKQFRNQRQLFRYQQFFNSDVSKPIMKPDGNVSKPIMKPGENVSKPIMKLKYNIYIYIYIYIPCYLVPSSRNRPLATSMTVPLHITLFLASASIFMMLSLAI